MALAEVCGVSVANSFRQNFAEDDGVHDQEQVFTNNMRHVSLALPPFSNPAKGLNSFSDESTGKTIKMNFAKGTTTLGFRFDGGIILTVDSRATGGNYIGSQTVKKIIEINDYLLGTMAGGAADCTYWERVLAKQCRIYELRNKERISVAAASKLLANMVYNYKGMGLSLGVMIAGWDKRGANLYYVDNEGQRIPGRLFSVGSGSTHAYSVLDNGYRPDLTVDEACDLGRRAVYHATHRDAMSGGIIRVYHVHKNGWTKVSEDDCMDLHYKYQEEKQLKTN